MSHLARIQVIQSHLLGHLDFPKDSSLDQYRLRGPQFPIKSFHDFYYGVGLEYYEELYPLFRSTKSLTHDNDFRLTKSEKRAKIIQQITEIKPKLTFTRQNHLENSLRGFVFGRLLFSYDMPFCIRIGVHSTLFIDSLLSLGTEKHNKIIDDSYAIREFGCFAMTELGHGSNVGALGTTATYIHETREFEINTSDPLAAKWWIGAAAKTATLCTVFAQLIVKGKLKGIHAFVVRLRDLPSLQIRSGIVIGDCGDKSELDGVDNGFIIFNKYRVPYDALLDKISSINEAGEFKSLISKNEKRLGRMLSSLIRGRTSVAYSSESNLRHALTASIRWASIRKQFGGPGKPESPILDYQLTRSRLMPNLANLFAINAACEVTFLNFDRIKELMNKDPECLEGVEFHAILSAFKVLTSEWAFNGIHESRKACGGIGYSSHNRLGELMGQQDVHLTWEGDNGVLLQQTSGFVIKQVQKLYQGKKITANTLLMTDINMDSLKQKKLSENFSDPSELLKALHMIYNILLHKNLLKLQESAGSHDNLFDTWNANQPYLQDLGKIFGIILMSEQLIKRYSTSSSEIRPIVEKIIQLFMVDKIIKYSSDLLLYGYLVKESFDKLESFLHVLCNEIGESAVRVIDSIADDDFMHGIPIGHSDGQAYKRLCEQIESQPDCYQPATWTHLTKALLDYKVSK